MVYTPYVGGDEFTSHAIDILERRCIILKMFEKHQCKKLKKEILMKGCRMESSSCRNITLLRMILFSAALLQTAGTKVEYIFAT